MFNQVEWADTQMTKDNIRRFSLTLSFILQLWAKALDPSIFSVWRFFMKASGRFQSVMSTSSSSARPTTGELSSSASIFIKNLEKELILINYNTESELTQSIKSKKKKKYRLELHQTINVKKSNSYNSYFISHQFQFN